MDRSKAPTGRGAAPLPWRRLLPVACGVGILALLAREVGAPAFVDGLRRVDAPSVAAALALTAVATVACAWRWRLVAGALGLEVPLRAAVPAYYRSQFLNSTVPGGVVGDVHRGVSHGTGAGDRSAGLRAVVWERAAGQAVQLTLALVVLLLVPATLGGALPVVAAVAVGAAAAVGVLAFRGTAAGDLRALIADRAVWPGVVLASVVVVAAHVGTFVVATRAVGVDLAALRVLPLAVLVLLAMAVPLNVAGFGPREGVAAWGFATAGAGAAAGVTVAVVYGVLALIATVPGALVLVLSRGRPRAASEAADG